MGKDEILNWLKEDREGVLERLFRRADEVRASNVGDAVHLRGLLEISNNCKRFCGYCGINAGNSGITRYRISYEEIMECVKEASDYGYGTIVMQAGEDEGIGYEFVERIIRKIKDDFGLAVTLSLGERSQEELVGWKKAGADRYLLRFETSNRKLYDLIHPPLKGREAFDRIEMLRRLRDIGYEIGSGVMIGLPGQSFNDLANDILTFAELDLDMIGVGPYIAHPDTLLGREPERYLLANDQQVRASEQMCYKVIALARIVCPQANIPATTALASINIADGREKGLCRGANVLMPNITPTEYRQYYEIYPSKACIYETAKQCRGCMAGRIRSIGRSIGSGAGSRMH
ncbi:MAG: [FeFe] hydrogenase H-cluster radical SAM maturase HydE [Sedimentisphaeraceae bacterium JB056]